MNFDKWLSVITTAGVVGLLILNARNTAEVFNAAGGNIVNYVKAVQGR